ncbi:MAG: enoyl-CoA hydratase [Actinomycetia bacterium]|nr:enoyl-CoA hydratase [Actinomycetes bacterium]
MADTDVLTIDITDRVATLTMNRPEARNALNRDLRAALPAAMADADGSDDVDVIILTGTDPAFCAGLDLRELGAGANRITGDSPDLVGRPWAVTTKPVIGAVNGPAITGGFELALNCDFLIASHRARFADTHARVGVMPGWGLSVLLPQAIGVRRARQLSLTGNFLDAHTALAWGLVNHVVDPVELLPTAHQLASDIAGNDQRGVARMLETYRAVTGTTIDDGWRIEARMGAEWARGGIDPASIEERRQAIVDRGRSQL